MCSSDPVPPAPVPSPGPDVEMPEVEILHDFKDASRWSTFHRIGYRVRRQGSAWVDQEREFLDRGDAVALLPYCPESGQVLLTRQFRMPVYVKRPAESLLIEVCGGILEDPDPTVTLRNEAREELGLELTSFHKAFEAYSTPGSACEKVHYFVGTYSAAQRLHPGGGLAHEGEEIEILEIPLTDALAQVQRGAILDARTITLLLYLATQLPPAGLHPD